MQKVRNSTGKLVCEVDSKTKTVKIVIKGCETVIQFLDNGKAKIINK